MPKKGKSYTRVFSDWLKDLKFGGPEKGRCVSQVRFPSPLSKSILMSVSTVIKNYLYFAVHSAYNHTHTNTL